MHADERFRILVTGTNSGFGHLMVRELRKRGHTVCASMRDVDSRNQQIAGELKSLGVHVVEMDISKDADVDRAVGHALETLGGLDVVVNNAGIGVLGLQEAFTIDDIRHVFDVNVLGVYRVNRCVIPTMRKQGAGLLVHISSLLGRMIMPFHGPYMASKWALEALAETYRYELAPCGIDSCIVEPGAFLTSGIDSLVLPSDGDRQAQYGDMAALPMQICSGLYQTVGAMESQVPQVVADAVADLIETPAGARPLRITADTMGLDTPIQAMNQTLEATTAGIFAQLGFDKIVARKAPEAAPEAVPTAMAPGTDPTAAPVAAPVVEGKILPAPRSAG